VSLSLLLIAAIALIIFNVPYLWASIAILVIVFGLIESILRGSVIRTVNRTAVVLAVIAALILIWQFWEQILIGVVLALAIYLLVQKIRELWD
jgi:hypothetical protein